MPWFVERDHWIPAERLARLMEQTVAEARQRICAKPKRVLLLPPDITRAHSGAGWLTEVLYNLLSDEAEVHVIPTLGQHVPHTPEENRRMFGAIPEDRIHAHDWRGGCVRARRDSGRLRPRSQPRRRRLAHPHPPQSHAHGGAVGPDRQRRARRAARGAGLRQSQQELFHRTGRQGDDLRRAHGGRLLRHREQPGHARHARPRLLQQGRERIPRQVARPLRPGRHGPQRRRADWCTPASTWATTWRPIWKPPGNRASRTSPSSTSRSRKSFA